MSLDIEHAMARNAREVLDLLHGYEDYPRDGVSMPFGIALDINSKLLAIVSMGEDLHTEIKQGRRELLEIIEGLMANWPATEIVEHYKPTDKRPVLMKEEALKRAAQAIRELNYP